MKTGKATLIDAVTAIRQSNFQKAFDLADSQARSDSDDFWAWYLAAVSLGFLKKKDTFEHYLNRAASLNPESPFILYLQAYLFLQKENIEQALIIWTRLVDHNEGWLARQLIEKARKSNNLISKAEKGDISYFIVLPDFPKLENFHTTPVQIRNPERTGKGNIEQDSSLYKRLLQNAGFVLAAGLLGAVIYNGVAWYTSGRQEDKSHLWKNLRIEDWAALVNTQNPKKEKYKYTSKEELIDDFEKAKQKLSGKKINQARYLLQKILTSNADFKTKEKCKIFLSFIPEPDYQDFSDPVMPDELLKGPEFYQDSLVLWQGTVINIKDVDRGKEVRLLVKSQNEDFIIDAFLPGVEKKSNWLPFDDYRKAKDMKEKKTQAIVYGKFKGLLGNQKNIYLELLKLWM